MKIDFEEEIWECFLQQYPKENQLYEKYCRCECKNAIEQMKTYNSMVDNFSFLIILMQKLEEENNLII